MESVPGESARAGARDADRRHRRATVDVKDGLRALSLQLSLLNRQVGAQPTLRDVDSDCLDLVDAHGPLSPSALARRAGRHAATMTGVPARLECAGWISREPDPADRRGSQVRALRDRHAELLALFAGMNTSVEQICADYEGAELERFADFLRRAAAAGRAATEDLAD